MDKYLDLARELKYLRGMGINVTPIVDPEFWTDPGASWLELRHLNLEKESRKYRPSHYWGLPEYLYEIYSHSLAMSNRIFKSVNSSSKLEQELKPHMWDKHEQKLP